VYDIPGNHDTITGDNYTRIEEAHMKDLAEKLRVCIDNALSGESSNGFRAHPG
jgi:hypothetical protein